MGSPVLAYDTYRTNGEQCRLIPAAEELCVRCHTRPRLERYRMCRRCRSEIGGERVECPGCGGLKTRAAPLCRKCYSAQRVADPGLCTKCGERKPPDEFYKRQNKAYPRCKTCIKKEMRGRRAAWTPQQRRAMADHHRDTKMRRLYGITLDEYWTLLRRQRGRCAICGTKDPGRRRKLFNVDHAHQTGEVRGLLCHMCNFGIGAFQDSAERLEKAIEYLQR